MVLPTNILVQIFINLTYSFIQKICSITLSVYKSAIRLTASAIKLPAVTHTCMDLLLLDSFPSMLKLSFNLEWSYMLELFVILISRAYYILSISSSYIKTEKTIFGLCDN